MKNPKILLPIDLQEVIMFDEKGERIVGVRAITSFKNGFVIITDKGMYTNVKSLIRNRHKTLRSK